MDQIDIKKVLPHRYPFLLIDKVLSVSHDKVVALKNVSINEPYFQGHFPSMPIMPGVLQIEAMAQAAGFLLAQEQGLGFLAGVDNAKFRHPVLPGDQLKIEVSLLAYKKGVLKVSAQIFVENKICSMAEITIVRKEK
jgi:beta-hydroxyacyl-ACP dehydratase FabZ